MNKILLIVVILLAVGFLSYLILIPKAFVAVGKKGMTADKLKITKISRTTTVNDDDAKPVTAAPGNRFVQLDCHVTIPFDQMDIYDFQLVRAKSSELGKEENVGDNSKDNHFFGIPITKDGIELKDFDLKSTDYYIRLVFQIPESANTGYLFYWGEYWGPLNL